MNAISPGYTDTPMFDLPKSKEPDQIVKLAQSVPLKRFANAFKIAEGALFLASSKASYIVGIDLVIDGGMSAIILCKMDERG